MALTEEHSISCANYFTLHWQPGAIFFTPSKNKKTIFHEKFKWEKKKKWYNFACHEPHYSMSPNLD